MHKVGHSDAVKASVLKAFDFAGEIVAVVSFYAVDVSICSKQFLQGTLEQIMSRFQFDWEPKDVSFSIG